MAASAVTTAVRRSSRRRHYGFGYARFGGVSETRRHRQGFSALSYSCTLFCKGIQNTANSGRLSRRVCVTFI